MGLKVPSGFTICPSPQRVSLSTQKVFVKQMEPLGLQNGASELAVGVQHSSILMLLQIHARWIMIATYCVEHWYPPGRASNLKQLSVSIRTEPRIPLRNRVADIGIPEHPPVAGRNNNPGCPLFRCVYIYGPEADFKI